MSKFVPALASFIAGMLIGQVSAAHADTSQITRKDLMTAAALGALVHRGGYWSSDDLRRELEKVLGAVDF